MAYKTTKPRTGKTGDMARSRGGKPPKARPSRGVGARAKSKARSIFNDLKKKLKD